MGKRKVLPLLKREEELGEGVDLEAGDEGVEGEEGVEAVEGEEGVEVDLEGEVEEEQPKELKLLAGEEIAVILVKNGKVARYYQAALKIYPNPILLTASGFHINKLVALSEMLKLKDYKDTCTITPTGMLIKLSL
jgi:hypothetical protein